MSCVEVGQRCGCRVLTKRQTHKGAPHLHSIQGNIPLHDGWTFQYKPNPTTCSTPPPSPAGDLLVVNGFQGASLPAFQHGHPRHAHLVQALHVLRRNPEPLYAQHSFSPAWPTPVPRLPAVPHLAPQSLLCWRLPGCHAPICLADFADTRRPMPALVNAESNPTMPYARPALLLKPAQNSMLA